MNKGSTTVDPDKKYWRLQIILAVDQINRLIEHQVLLNKYESAQLRI
jgi:hypothetical protein